MKLFTISLPSARAAVRQASIILLAVSSMLTYASAKTGNPKGNPGKGLSTCPTSISINIAPPAAYCTNTQGVLSVTSDGGSFTSPSYTWSASSSRITITPTNSATPDIDYITVGTVTISVTVTDASCGTYTASQTIYVSSTPEPTITIPTTEVCEGNTITNITGSPSGNTRQWTVNEFSSGNPFGIFSAPTNQTTNFTTNHPGNAEIRYEVTTSAGCTGTSEAQPVTIYAPVVATASVASGNQPNVCAGSSLTLAASATGGNGTYTYEWEYMGGSQAVPAFVSAAILLDSLDVANPVLTPVGTASDGDTYIFRVKATDGITCNDFSDNITITVRQITSAALSLTGASTICEDGTTTFKVDVTRGNTGGSPTYTLVYNDGTADSTIANYVSGTELTTRALNADYTLQIVSIKDNRVTTSNCSSPSNSGTPGVTVNNLTAGSITGAVTICSGDDPDVFGSTAASGDGTITYLWESSTDGTSFTSTGIVTETFDPGVLTADTWYRRVATSTLNAVACSKTSNTIKVTVNNISATGSIGNAQTICPNTTPTSLSSTFGATGDGTISYQWHSSTDGVTFSPISGANSASGYAPGALDNDTWYRLVATSTISADPVTCTTTSNDIWIKVNNITSPGGIDSDQTVCAGETPAALTSTAAATGDGTISYQWQESTNNYTDYTDITGETSAGYSPPSASGDKWYLRIPISTEDAVSCPGESPLPVAITLNSITAGNIEGDTTICTGNDVSFTQSVAAVYDGAISYEWQSSTDGGNTWSPLASSNSATYTTAALTQTTKFRRKDISTLNSVECFAYTDTLTVTVITTNSGTWYVNDATGDDADLGTINCPKKTIQAAVNAAAAGDTVIVAAGTYAENVTIGKALDVRGPNWDVSPNGGSRVAEAIVVPAATNTSSGAVVTISTGNVSFRGFTLDGDNPGLASSNVGLGGVLGTSIDAARGIFLQANGITGVTISKNIAKNAVNGIRLEQTTNYFASGGPSGAVRSTNILVNDNKVQDMTGTGIRLGNSMYAKVTNNTVTNAENGIAFSSFRISDAGAASDRVIANNTITSRYSGIWVNLFHASPYALNNNTISVAPAATEMAPTPQSRTAWFGIMYSTVSAPQNFTDQTNLPKVTTPEYWTATGNAINGSALEESSTGYGYWFYYVDNNRDDMNVDHFGQISGGTVSGVDVGIMLKNKDTDPATNFGNAAIGAHAGVSGVAFSLRSGGTGFRLVDDATWITSNPTPLINKRTVQLTIGAGVSITGGATGLKIEHPPVGTSNYTAYSSITGGDLSDLAFSGQTGNYVELSNHPNGLTATAATFGGKTGATATLAENFDIEDKISHKLDDATRGLVRVKAAEVFVTTNSGLIQRGVDAASDSDIVNVKAGTYAEVIAIDKPLSLLGPNADIPGNASREAEAIVEIPTGAANGEVLIYAGSELTGVTISGFDLRCPDATIPYYHYLIYTEKINNLTIRNNRMYGSEIPMYILTSNGQNDFRTGLLVEGNYVDGGPNVNSSYSRGIYVQSTSGTIQDNQFVNTNIGIQYMPYGHTTPGTIQRNTISANLIGLYHNYQNKGAAAVTWSQNVVTVAANDRAGLKASVDGAYTTQQLIFRGIEAITFGTEGSGPAPEVTFSNNSINGTGASGSNYSTSVGFRNETAAATGVATLTENSFENVVSGVVNNATVSVAATCNWWGSKNGNTIVAQLTGPVSYSPWLVSGTDSDGAASGFQPASGTCTGRFPVVTLDTKQRISCFGGSNGAININIADGTAPFSYSWTGPSSYTNTTDQDIASLSAGGTYDLTLTDDNGTTVTFSESITAPSAAVSASVAHTDITCFGANDGTITVSSPAGGYGTYETSINGTEWYVVTGAAPYTFSSLTPASYNVRVRDAEETSCVTDLDDAGDTEISEPAVLSATVNKTNVTCNAANDGTITVSSPAGGYGTYEYRLDAGSWQSGGSFTALPPATYSVQIRDAAQTACVITLGDQTITEPAVLSATVAKTDVTCNGVDDGTITVSNPAGGYGTYEYRLDDGTWESNGSFTGLAPATYSVQIRDAAQTACVITLGDQTITEPAVLSATVAKTDVTCNGAGDGTITVSNPEGGYGTYQYRLDAGSWQSSGFFTGLAPATYSVQIRDAANTACEIVLGDQTISQPEALTVSVPSATLSCNNGATTTLTATPAGGTSPYTYAWSVGGSSATTTALGVGDYTVTVTDANSCEVISSAASVSNPVHPGDGIWYVNDNSLDGDLLTTAVGNNTNIGTASCPFLTVSHAITQASAGHTINVDVGTYSENVVVSKSLTLKGAQFGVKATGSDRAGETVINGTGGSSSFVVTVEADNVTIDGFKVEIRSSARDGINTRVGSPVGPATTAVRSEISLRNNWIYANLPARTNQFNGIVFGEHTSNTAQSFSAEINNVTIKDNYIDLISTSDNATPASTSITGARGIVFTNMFRNSGASLTYNDLVVDDNTVFSTYNTIIQAQLQTKLDGATFTNNIIGNSRSGPNLPTLINGSVFSNNTIQNINPGSDYYSNLTGAYLGVVNSTVERNVFQNIRGTACLVIAGGRSADATYFPASSNSTVSNNFFTYNDQALSSLASYTSAILIEPNTIAAAVNVNGWLTGRQPGTTGADASTITVSNNSMVNAAFNPSATTYAISQESANETLAATCNWYGAASDPASKITGPVTYSSWLVDGTDSDGSTKGFQPAAGTCTGTPVVISAATVDNIWCGETTGSIEVTFSGGTGPYDIAWTGGSATGVTSPYTVSGLAAGTYGVTVTDANSSTDTEAGLVIEYLPVHNTSADTRHATIQAAIDAADDGDVIEVCAGNYTENLSVGKRLTIDGAGSGSASASNTIITSATASTPTIKITTGGASSTDRLVVKDLRVTGATTGGNSGSGFLIEPTAPISHISIDNIVSTGNGGHGVAFNGSPAVSDVKILNSTVSSNSETGIRIASSVTSFTDLLIDGCTISTNGHSGFAFNPSGTLSNIGTGFIINNSTFTGNTTANASNTHDLSFFGFTGNATLTNVTVTAGNGITANSNNYGISFDRGTAGGPLGTVALTNVVVSGHVGKGALLFQRYNDVSGASLSGVSLNDCVAPWGSLILSHTGTGAFPVGNTNLRSIAIWNSGDADATLTNFYHSTTNVALNKSTLADCFQIEDQVTHKVDVATLGFVRVKANEVFVTPNSFASPETSPSIQRGIDAATAGDIVNVQAGPYTGNVDINKAVDLRGANYGVSGCETRSSESVVQGAFTIGADGITVDGFEFTGTNAAIASTSGPTVRSNITIRNNYLHATTAQIPIRHGLGLGGGIGSENWIVTDNKISDIQLDNATAIALFNITNATVDDNCIEHTNSSYNGRRGINADGLQSSQINNNTINLGGSGSTNVDGNWMIQVSMSDRDAQDLEIDGNTLSGAYFGISTLSQRNVSNITISNNAIGPVSLGITMNGGSATPAISQPLQSNISITNNSITTVTPTVTGGVGAAVRLRNLHEGHANGPVGFSNVIINDNSFTVPSGDMAIINNNSGYTPNAECNWYGTTTAADIAGKITGTVDYSPWLINGTDDEPSTPGFQPVTDACAAEVVVTLVESVNIEDCNGDATGSIDISVSGGATPYTYSWSNSATDQDISGVQAGTYTVTVTDNIGTFATLEVTLTQPSAIVPTATPTHVSCNGGYNGSIELSVSGGTPGTAPAYTYSWSGPNSFTSTDEDISSRPAGIYTVVVTDGNGCAATTTATITEPDVLTASISAPTNVSCNGGSNGSATVSASGGTAPYSYEWPGTPTGDGTVTASGLAAGDHTVTVTDANGCTTTATATITEPDALIASITAQTNVSCNGLSDGTATVTASGGTTAYSYNWPGTPTGDGTDTASGLAAGDYIVTVTDANSCLTTATATITQPDALSLSTSQTNVSCRDGSNGTATVTPAGGTSPYDYDWDGTPTGDGSATITDLAAASYTVTVTDDEGCTSTATVTITQPAVLAITASPVDATATGSCPTSTDIATQFNTWNTAISVSGGVNPQITTEYAVTDQANNTSTVIYTGETATAPPNDGGFTTVTWTVTDSCGNTATASATFTVNNCMRVSGNILFYRDSSGLDGVAVDMVGTGANDDLSVGSGAYSVYSTTTAGTTFTVTPSKAFAMSPADTNRVTGIINVHDVQAIQQHVGSGTQFSSIYQRVAANVVLGTSGSQTNNRLTSSDATSLSQAINGSSVQRARLRWRFIPSDSSLIVGAPTPLPRSWGLVPDTGNVAGNQAPSSYGKFPIKRNYDPLNGPWTGQDFTAVLVGDVVPNPTSIGNNGAEVRYAGTPLVWRVKDANLKKGETIEAVFTAEQFTDIKGWQFGLHFDPEYLQVEDLTTTAALPLDTEVNFGLYQADQGDIRSLWADAEKQSLKAGERVFTVRFKVLQGGRTLSSVLGLDDDVLETYALSENLDRVAVLLAFDGVRPVSESPVLHQNTPNPFDKETRVRFELPSDSDIQLTIHDVNGRLIKEFNGFYSQGLHELRFGRGELGQHAGILYYTLRCGEFTATRKMVVID